MEDELLKCLKTEPGKGMCLVMYRYMGLMIQIAYSHLQTAGGMAAAEECVHDAFAEFYKSLPSFDPAKGTIKAYLAVIVKLRQVIKAALGLKANTVDKKAQRAFGKLRGVLEGRKGRLLLTIPGFLFTTDEVSKELTVSIPGEEGGSPTGKRAKLAYCTIGVAAGLHDEPEMEKLRSIFPLTVHLEEVGG